MDLHVIVLAAGRGKRMASPLPKVLHPVAGQPMLARILRAILGLKPTSIRVVLGPSAEIISTVAGAFKALCFQQDPTTLGTAQAVLAAKPEELSGDLLIINGDHPLIQSADLSQFVRTYRELSVDMGVASFKNPQANEYGRLFLEGKQLVDIVEAYEIEKTKKHSDFVNAGLYLLKASLATKYLKEVKKNIKGEYNLTDLISILNEKKYKLRAISVPWHVAYGVNSQRELSLANSIAFENNNLNHMDKGVIILDIKNTYIEDLVSIGQGSLIYPGAYIRGQSQIGAFCAIEPQAYIFDSLIKNYVNIRAGSYIEGSLIEEKSVIGPYAHLRPETKIGRACRVGNFVEIKKSTLGAGSKASHLSYLGDAKIGKEVNIGCGTVTCNYSADKQKHPTVIKDSAFIGSGSQLVAPVEIGSGAVVGAGSVITKNVPDKALGIARGQQKNIPNYKENKNKN